MALAQGWAIKTWRCKKVACHVTSTGMGFLNITGTPQNWHFTLTTGSPGERGAEQMEITFSPDEVRDLVASMQEFLARREFHMGKEKTT